MTGTDVLNAAHADPKVLFSGQLSATTETTLYTAPTSSPAGSCTLKQGAVSNVTPSYTTLSSGISTGGPITALPVAALPAAIPSGATVTVVTAGNSQQFTTSGSAAAAATSIPVNSQTPSFAFPSGSDVTYAGRTVVVSLSLLQVGQTSGNNQHRLIYEYPLGGGDSLPLLDYLGGACLGPGDFISAQVSVANAIDVVLSGIEYT